MAGFYNRKRDRKVIPRWGTFESTLRLGALESCLRPRPRAEVPDDFLVSRVSSWKRYRTVGHAVDLVGAALTSGRTSQAVEAARFLLNRDVSPWAKELAEKTLESTTASAMDESIQRLDASKLRERVHTLRLWLRAAPRDSISWVDLSLAYIALGQRERAKRCMASALHLAANNRFTLRAASRLWIHLDDPERAHDVIFKSDLTPHDPWLLSAEIAISDTIGKTSRFIKRARRVLSGRAFSPRHLSELASAIATLEQESGKVIKSRRLYDQSLENPTENSIAQAEWASTRDPGMRFEKDHLKVKNTFEARSEVFYKDGDWDRAAYACHDWQSDQPFSKQPGVFGSYVSAVVLENYADSKLFADRGLVANPGDFVLLNNLAFACINSGEMGKARTALKKMEIGAISGSHRAVFQATSGLLAFRTGDAPRGRELYLDALSIARKEKDEALYALAASFYAIEELSINGSDCRRIASEALSALKKIDKSVSDELVRRLRKIARSKRQILD